MHNWVKGRRERHWGANLRLLPAWQLLPKPQTICQIKRQRPTCRHVQISWSARKLRPNNKSSRLMAIPTKELEWKSVDNWCWTWPACNSMRTCCQEFLQRHLCPLKSWRPSPRWY